MPDYNLPKLREHFLSLSLSLPLSVCLSVSLCVCHMLQTLCSHLFKKSDNELSLSERVRGRECVDKHMQATH